MLADACPPTPAKAPISAVWRIVRLPDLSDAAARLWLFYRGLHFESRGGAYPTDEMTANALRWSARKVQGARAELVRADLLVVRQRGPRPPAYFPLDPAAPKGSQSAADLGSQDSAGLESEGSQEGSQNSVVAYKERTCKPVKPSPKGPEKKRRENQQATDAQTLTNYVMEVGMHGQRFSDYAKQAKRAQDLLKQHPLEELKRVVDALGQRFPFSDGRAFDVFDLGKNIDKVLGELRRATADPAIERALRERDRGIEEGHKIDQELAARRDRKKAPVA